MRNFIRDMIAAMALVAFIVGGVATAASLYDLYQSLRPGANDTGVIFGNVGGAVGVIEYGVLGMTFFMASAVLMLAIIATRPDPGQSS